MENKRAHLAMIQGVINRMAGNSFLLKGWTVTLVAALFVLAQKGSNSAFTNLAYFPTVVFWGLDGYYLWQERLFRKLYDKVRPMDETAIDFSMDTKPVRKEAGSWLKATHSTTLIPFYGIILLTIAIVFRMSR